MLYSTRRKGRFFVTCIILFTINNTLYLVLLICCEIGEVIDMDTVFLSYYYEIIKRIEHTPLPENIMRFKKHITYNSIPCRRSNGQSIEFDRTEKPWCRAFRCSGVDRCDVRLAYNDTSLLFRWLPALILCLNQPFVKFKWSIGSLIWFVYGKRTLRRHFRDKFSLGLAYTRVFVLEHTGLIDKAIISCRLQRSSGSCWHDVHTYTIHTILLPEHT
jgi:hypothetical protein